MTTYIGVGPAAVINGPLPKPPEYSLLSIPGVVQTDDARWRGGIAIWGYPEEVPLLWEPCQDGTFREKTVTPTASSPRFDPFAAYVAFECSTMSGPVSEFGDRAEAVLDATISYAVERALADGISGSSNPFFADGNLTQLGGGPVTAQIGLSYLENAIAATGRQGIIHATPGTVAQWDDLLTDGGVLHTKSGTPIAVGGGYLDIDPVGKTGSDPTAGQEWAFATGPVLVYLGQAQRPDVPQFVNQNTNLATYIAERFVVAGWDTALQSGVLIDWVP